MATTLSAVTKNYVAAHELAAGQLDAEAGSLRKMVDGLRFRAARAGSMFSDPKDTAACYLIDDMRKAARTLTLSADAHRQKVDALLRAPCPCCMTGHRQHCSACGSCPGRGKGPSCQDLDCEKTARVPVGSGATSRH